MDLSTYRTPAILRRCWRTQWRWHSRNVRAYPSCRGWCSRPACVSGIPPSWAAPLSAPCGTESPPRSAYHSPSGPSFFTVQRSKRGPALLLSSPLQPRHLLVWLSGCGTRLFLLCWIYIMVDTPLPACWCRRCFVPPLSEQQLPAPGRISLSPSPVCHSASTDRTLVLESN